jgi:hypothetical protein
VKLDATAKLAERQMTIKALAGDVEGNAVNASGSVDWRGDVAKIAGTLSVDRADLEWLAQSVLGQLRDPATGWLVETALPKAIAQTEFAVDLAAKAFTPGHGGVIEAFTAKVSRKAGELVMDEIAGQWLGGQVAGRVSLANTEGNGFLQSRLDLRGLDLARTLTALRAERGIEDAVSASGVFDATFVAEGTGHSAAELIGGASGSGTITLPTLQLTGFGLDILPELLREADAIGTAINEEKVREITGRLTAAGRADLSGLTLSLALADGVVRIQNATLQTPHARLGGDLRLNLAEGELESAVQVSLDAGEAALAGTDSAYRLLFSGEALSPQQTLDVADLTNFLSLRAFETERRRVEKLQSNVLEKQRLRREAALARFRQAERDKAEVERLRLEEEAKLKAEAEAAERLAQELRNQTRETAVSPVPEQSPRSTESVPSSPTLPVVPGEKVTRQPLPPMPLIFDSLPNGN